MAHSEVMGEIFRNRESYWAFLLKAACGILWVVQEPQAKNFFQTQLRASYRQGERIWVSTQASCLRSIRFRGMVVYMFYIFEDFKIYICFTGWLNSVLREAWICFWCCLEWRHLLKNKKRKRKRKTKLANRINEP